MGAPWGREAPAPRYPITYEWPNSSNTDPRYGERKPPVTTGSMGYAFETQLKPVIDPIAGGYYVRPAWEYVGPIWAWFIRGPVETSIGGRQAGNVYSAPLAPPSTRQI